MTTTKKKYFDVETEKSYDEVPEGKVVVTDYKSLSPKAQNWYLEYLNRKYPYKLPEVEIVAQGNSQDNSQDLPIIDPTETDQNLKVRDYNKKADRWINSEYSPENQFNNYTFGLPNRLSPTQNIGLAIDAFQGDNIWNSMMGNSGIVSDQFYRDNPKLATGINLLGDMAIPYSTYKTYQFVKPNIRNYIISRALNKEVRNTALPQESFGFNVGWGPKQTIGVTHASEPYNNLGLYNPNILDPKLISIKSQPHNYGTFGTSIKADEALDLRPNFLEWPEAKNIRGFYKNIFFPKYYSNRKNLYIQPKFNFMSPGVPGRFKISTKDMGNLGGVSKDGESTIYLNNKFPIDETVVHEGSHNFRDNFSDISNDEFIARAYNNAISNKLYEPTLKNPKYYTEQELQGLNDAYTFTDDFLANNRIHPMAEKSATNTQAQYAIAKASGAKTPQELNIVIDKMSDDDILYTIQQSNSYGRSFVQHIRSLSPEQQAFKIRAVRNALKTIPVVGGIYTIGNKE